jgi:hypothetical protein
VASRWMATLAIAVAACGPRDRPRVRLRRVRAPPVPGA